MIPTPMVKRAEALEARFQPAGCDRCRGWSCLVVDLGAKPVRPEACPNCSRRVPFRLIVLGAREDGPQ